MACEVDVNEVVGTNLALQLSRQSSGKVKPILIKNEKHWPTAIRTLGARKLELSKEMTVNEKKRAKKNHSKDIRSTISSFFEM